MESKAALHVKMAILSSSHQSSVFAVKNSVQCRPKCAACCTRYIPVTLAEAVVMTEYLKQRNRWDQVEKASLALAETSASARPVSWFKMGIKCPVLGQDNLCMAYAVRPVACSAHFVLSNPLLCSASGEAQGQYRPAECEEAHASFAKSFIAAVSEDSRMRLRGPIPVALLAADRLSKGQKVDFDNLLETFRRKT